MRYVWMGLGIAVGVGVGLWLDRLVLGLVGGVTLGVVLAALLNRRA